MFPARVGMNRAERSRAGNGTCVPRASGDEPFRVVRLAFSVTCSPREWG